MSSTSAKFNNSSWINEKLISYGARTSGSLEQRQSRLQRFMKLDQKLAIPTPTKPAKKTRAPGAPVKKPAEDPVYTTLEFSSREDDDSIYMPLEGRAIGKLMPSPPFTNTAEDYKELRLMAEAAGMLEDEDEEEDSDYEPSDADDESDSVSLAHTADMEADELYSLETAVDDTWEIYINSIGKQKLRAIKELSDLVDQLYQFHLSS
jgi:hypothetical protein